MLIGLIMLVVLGIICHQVAARAAKKQMQDEDAAEAAEKS
jgi:hypothetical protein